MVFPWLVVIGGAALLLYTVAALAVRNPHFPLDLRGMGPVRRRWAGVSLGVVGAAGAYRIIRPFVEGLLPSGVSYTLRLVSIVVLIAALGYFFALPFSKTRWCVIAASGTFVAGVVLYMYWPNWVTVDLMTAVVVVAALSAIAWMRLSFQTVLLVTTVLVVRDVWGVYFGSTIKDTTNAITQAQPPPSHFLIPADWQLHAKYAGSLGAMDVIVPGLLIITAAFAARQWWCPALLYGSLIGYCLGLTAGVVVVEITGAPQPGFLYICLAVIIGILLPAWREGLLSELWRYGAPEKPKQPPAD